MDITGREDRDTKVHVTLQNCKLDKELNRRLACFCSLLRTN